MAAVNALAGTAVFAELMGEVMASRRGGTRAEIAAGHGSVVPRRRLAGSPPGGSARPGSGRSAARMPHRDRHLLRCVSLSALPRPGQLTVTGAAQRAKVFRRVRPAKGSRNGTGRHGRGVRLQAFQRSVSLAAGYAYRRWTTQTLNRGVLNATTAQFCPQVVIIHDDRDGRTVLWAGPRVWMAQRARLS